MDLFGVLNASPDSLNPESIVRTADDARRRAEQLVAEGVWGFDLGGQGSTFAATQTTPDEEWARLAPVLPVLAGFGLPLSVDTWNPEIARRALAHGATWLNAADGMQQEAMWELAADTGCPVVLPFLSGPDPLHLEIVADHDPVAVILDFFEAALRTADRYGVRENLVLDPGTGFAPHDWPWEERFLYQKQVYGNLDRLRVFDLPLYIALPWKDTPQHAELLDIVIAGDPEYGRAHFPAVVKAAEARAGAAAADRGVDGA